MLCSKIKMTTATIAAVTLGALMVITMAATASTADNLSLRQAPVVGTDGISSGQSIDLRLESAEHGLRRRLLAEGHASATNDEEENAGAIEFGVHRRPIGWANAKRVEDRKLDADDAKKHDAAVKSDGGGKKLDAEKDAAEKKPKTEDTKPASTEKKPKKMADAATPTKDEKNKAQLAKPARPNSMKDVDRYKEKLKKTREELLKNNPKLKKKVEAKQKKAAEEGEKKKQKAKEKETQKVNEKAKAGHDNDFGKSTSVAKTDSPMTGGKEKLAEVDEQLRKKKALESLNDVLRKGNGVDGAKAKAKAGNNAGDEKKKERGKANDAKDSDHQRRSRPLRPGERVFSKLPIVKRAYKKTPLEDTFSDATLAFVEGLKHGVFPDAVGPLDHRRKEALREWLALLSASLPPELALHSLINDLMANIDTVSKMKSNLIKTIKKHPIKERKWSAACSKAGKRSEHGGFSCAFWKLLHIVSVGLAEQRGGMDVGKEDAITPMKAADTLREYMALFFGCDVCTRNFISQYDQCAYRRCDRLAESAGDLPDEEWYELALYLWEFHNGVSVSVYHDKTDTAKTKGKDEISVIYPNMEECFLCLGEDGIFDDEQITRHLVETYWAGPERDSKDDMLRTYERSLERPLVSTTVLYASFSMMLLAAYVMKRRYIKRTGHHKKFDAPNSNGYSKTAKKWRRI